MPLGYSSGQPFGDPGQFTRSTGESEVDQFNTWLRSQPWHQQYMATRLARGGGRANLSEREQKELAEIAKANGVPIADAFSMDQAGNLNQNSRTARNIAIAAAIAGGAFGAYAALPALAGGGAGAAGATGGTAGALGTLAAPTAPMIGGMIGGTGMAATGAAALPAFGAAGAGTAAAGAGAAGGAGTLSTLGRYANIANQAGRVATGAAESRAAQREREAYANTLADRTAIEGARLNLQAPQIRATNAVRGDTLANLQPVSFSGPLTGTGGRMPTRTGGLSPAILSQTSRDLGREMTRRAYLDQLKGPAFTQTPMPRPNRWDRTLSVLGGVGAAAGAYNEAF